MNIYDVCEEHNIKLHEINKHFWEYHQPEKDTHYAMKDRKIVFIGNLKTFAHWCKNVEYNISRHNIYGIK